MGTDIDDDVRNGTGQLLCVGEINALVGGVCVRVRAEDTHRHDESLRVKTTELREEGDGAAHTVGTVVLTLVESFAGIVDDFMQPWFGVFHAPTITVVVTLNVDFAVVRHISGELLLDNLGSNL